MPVLTADPEAKAIIAEAQPGTRVTVDRPLYSTRARYAMLPAAPGELVKELRTDDVTLETLSAMRGDSTIAAGLRLMSTPVVAHIRHAAVKSDDPKVQRFVEHCLLDSGLLYRLAEQCCAALGLGCAINELVWQREDVGHLTYEEDGGNEQPAWTLPGPALTYEDIAPVNPVTVPAFNRLPEGLGFTQNTSNGPTDVAPAKAFVYTHDQEFGNHWGKARDRDAYPFWLWKHFVLKSWMHWVEKKADPSRVGYYPPGQDRTSGNDNQALLIDILDRIDGVAGVVFPNSRTTAPDGRDAGPAWLLQEAKTTDATQIFLATFSALCTEILRAMFMPERVFQEGQFGTKAEAETHTDIFLLSLDAFLWSLITAFEQGVIRPLVLVNFGSTAAKAQLEVEGLTEDERSLLHDVLLGLLTTPQAQAVLDVKAIAERRGVPVLDAPPAAPVGMAAPFGAAGSQATPPASNSSGIAPAAGDPANLVLTEPPDELAVLLDDIARYLRDQYQQRIALAASAPQAAAAASPQVAQRAQQVRSERDALQAEIAGLPRLLATKAVQSRGYKVEQMAADPDTAAAAARDLAAANPQNIYTVFQGGGGYIVASQPLDPAAEQRAEAHANTPAGAAAGKPKLSDVVETARAQIHALLSALPEDDEDQLVHVGPGGAVDEA